MHFAGIGAIFKNSVLRWYKAPGQCGRPARLNGVDDGEYSGDFQVFQLPEAACSAPPTMFLKAGRASGGCLPTPDRVRGNCFSIDPRLRSSLDRAPVFLWKTLKLLLEGKSNCVWMIPTIVRLDLGALDFQPFASAPHQILIFFRGNPVNLFPLCAAGTREREIVLGVARFSPEKNSFSPF